MRSLVLLLSLFILGGCSPRKGEPAEAPIVTDPRIETECISRIASHRWFDPFRPSNAMQGEKPADNPPLVALVVHGLNNQPAMMDPLIGLLNSHSVPALRLSLSGHEPTEDMERKATVDRWRCDIDQGLNQLRTRYPKSVIVGVGFSLGATMLADAVVRKTPMPFAGLVMLAPAIKFTWRGTAIRLISVLRAFGIALKSKSLVEYRAHDETPLSAYHALFTLASGLVQHSSANRLAILPTLILVSPRDELVSMTGLSHWIAENALRSWRLEPVAPHASMKGSYQHLIVDEPSLGSDEWQRIKVMITVFLKGIAETQPMNPLLRQTSIPGAANLE